MSARPDDAFGRFLWGRGAFAPVPGGRVFLESSAPALSLPEWARRKRVVVGGPRAGKWNPANAPAALEPMAAFSDRGVSTIAIMAPTQLLKSEFAVNCVSYTAVHGRDVLFYEPDYQLLASFVGDRIRPALLACGAVNTAGLDAGLLKKKDTVMELRYVGGGKVTGLTPGMRSGKAAYTAPVVVLDELDAMATPGMVQVAKARATTYMGDAKIVSVSVPSEDVAGSIYREWANGSRGEFRGRCPRCHETVRMTWARVHFEKDDDGMWLATWGEGPEESAAIVCEACEARWTEAERQEAIRNGRYVHRYPDHPDRSFWVPGPAHHWRSIRYIVQTGAEAWRGAQEDEEWETYRRFINEWAGDVWTAEDQGLSARKLKEQTYLTRSRAEDDLGELHPDVLLVTAGADVGEHAIYAEWVGWGIDGKTGRVRSWGLQYRIIGGQPSDSIEDPELWDEFERALDTSVWRHPLVESGRVGAQRVLVDARYRAEIVTAWTQGLYARSLKSARVRGPAAPYGARVLPSMSKSRELGGFPVTLTAADARAKRRRDPLPWVVILESNEIKSWVYEGWKLDRRQPDGVPPAHEWPENPGAMGYYAAYFDEIAAEYPVPRRMPRGVTEIRWETKRGQAGVNEAWDCRIYAAAAAFVEAYPRPVRDHLADLYERTRKLRVKAAVRALTEEARKRFGLTGEEADGNIVPLRPDKPLDDD